MTVAGLAKAEWLLNSEDGKEKAKATAEAHHLDPRWFLDTTYQLSNALSTDCVVLLLGIGV